MLDRDGRVATWNRGAERLKGYTAAEILGSHLTRFYPPGTPRERVVEHLEQAEREGRYREEGWRVRKDGSLFWADVTLTAVRDGQGLLRGFAKVTKDRTESLRAQQQLQRLAALLSESQRLTHIGSWEWDTVTNDVLWSDEMYRIYGLEPTPGTRNSLGGGFLDRVHGDDRERVAGELRQALAERRSFSFEHRVVRPDGEPRVLLTQGRTVLDEGGKALRMIGTGQDVTDLRSAEREHAAVEGARRERRGPPRGRGALPDHGRHRAGDGVDGRPGQAVRLVQPALARVHGPHAGAGARQRLGRGRAPRGPRALRFDLHRRLRPPRELPPGVPAAAPRRRVPLGARQRDAALRAGGLRRLRRLVHRHQRPARGGRRARAAAGRVAQPRGSRPSRRAGSRTSSWPCCRTSCAHR